MKALSLFPGGIAPAAGWLELLARLERGTILVVGAPGTGKSALARYLLAQLGRSGRAALVDGDPGGGGIGVPGCLTLALTAPWRAPAALGFVGETSAAGQALALAVGSGVLAERARRESVAWTLVDTCAFLGGEEDRLRAIHQTAAVRAAQVVAVQRAGECESLLSLLAEEGRAIHRLAASPLARRPDGEERRKRCSARLAAHFAAATPRLFDPRRLVDRSLRPWPFTTEVASGTVVGLLDGGGLCLGLGRIDRLHRDRVEVTTAVAPAGVARLRLGGFLVAEGGSEASAADTGVPLAPARHAAGRGTP